MIFDKAQWWDTTVKFEHVEKENLIEWLDMNADRWVIAKEEGKGGYLHWQIRMVFKEPVEMGYLQMILPTAHWTPTQVRNFEYIYKGGEFITSWDEVLRKYLDIELWEWQCNAYNRFMLQNERQILCIVDKVGNKGKSWLSRHIVARHEARLLPTSDDARNLVQYAMAEASTGYIIDVPRRGTLKKGFWEGIEQIKGGHLYETRYAFSEKWIEPPRVMVITNKEPDTKDLSKDRWDIMRI